MAALPKETLRSIRRIHIRTKQLVDSLLSGAYKSVFKGRGIEFAEVREYQAGDEVRHIDWNVSARMGSPFVKSFHEERELTLMLVVDVSASMQFGSKQSKAEMMAEIAALLALSAVGNQDKVGLLLFSDKIECYVPPRSGVRHALRIIREIFVTRTEMRGTDLNMALAYLGKIQKRRCVCFILSDFLTEGYERALTIAAKHYDLIGIRTTDEREWVISSNSLVQMKDLESGKMALVDLKSISAKEQRTQMEQAREQITALFHKHGAGFIDLYSGEPYTPAIHKYFLSRQSRR